MPEAVACQNAGRCHPAGRLTSSEQVDQGEVRVSLRGTVTSGARTRPSLTISAGMHDGGYRGVDRLLAESLGPLEVSDQSTICPVAKSLAVFGGPAQMDGVSINRVFPGSFDGKPTERLGAWLMDNSIRRADAYIDLHSGAIDEELQGFVGYRRSGSGPVEAGACATTAHAARIGDVMLGADGRGGNSHAAAAREGVSAMLIERGQLGQRDTRAAKARLARFTRWLRHVGTPPEGKRGSSATTLTNWFWVSKAHASVAGLPYLRTTPGEDVTRGRVLGHLVNLGSQIFREVRAEVAGRVLYELHGLPAGQNALLTAIAASCASGFETPPSTSKSNSGKNRRARASH